MRRSKNQDSGSSRPIGADALAQCEQAIRSGDTSTWQAASLKLARLARSRASARLFLSYLSTHHAPEMRVRSVPGLSQLARANGPAREALLVLARDSDPTVRTAACRAIASQRESESWLEQQLNPADQSGWVGVAQGLGDALGSGQEWALERLRNLLAKGPARYPAALVLGEAPAQFARQALQALSEACEAEGFAWPELSMAAGRLAAARPRQALGLLQNMAGQPNPGARWAATVGLARLPARAPGSAGLAGRLADDANPDVRYRLAISLGEWHAGPTKLRMSLLSRLARDEDPEVAGAALEALGELGSLREECAPDCLALLQAAAGHRQEQVRAGSAAGLGRLAKRFPEQTEQQFPALAHDPHPSVRAAAVLSAGSLAPAKLLALLKSLGRERDERVLKAIGLTLAIKDRLPAGGVDLLGRLVRHPSPAVRRSAIQALAGGHAEVVFGLLRLAAQDPLLKRAAGEASAAVLSQPGGVDRLLLLAEGESAAEVFERISALAEDPRVAKLAEAIYRVLDGQPPGETLGLMISVDAPVGLQQAVRAAKRALEAGSLAEIAAFSALRPDPEWPLGLGRLARALVAAANQIQTTDIENGAPRGASVLARCSRELEKAAALAGELPAFTRRLAEETVGRWQVAIVASSSALKNGAELEVIPVCRQFIWDGRLNAALEIANRGGSPARNVVVRLEGDASPSEIRLGGLKRHECKRVEFWLAPDRCLAIKGEVAYQDRERTDRRLPFAFSVRVVPRRGLRRPIANPYAPGKPLPSESPMFFGRRQVFKFLKDHLSGAYQDNVVVLVGARRTGKTSILRQLPVHLGDRYIPVLLDAQEMLVDDVPLFFHQVARRISEASAPYLSAGLAAPGTARQDECVQILAGYLEQVSRGAGDRHLLIAIDEFDDLEHKVRGGLLPPNMFGYLRHLIQYSPRVAFVLAGTQRLEQLGADYWSSLFNLAFYHRVGLLEREEALDLVRVPLKRLRIPWDDLAVEKLLDLTGGHPYFLQLACHSLVNRCNHLRQRFVSVEDVEAETERMLEWGEIHLRYLWDQADSAERAALVSLAAGRRPPDRAATGRLSEREVLKPDGGGFVMRLFEKWVRRMAGRSPSVHQVGCRCSLCPPVTSDLSDLTPSRRG